MITAQAIVSPTSVLYCVFIILNANGNVFISCFVQATNGHKKLFHAPTNVKIDNASNEDLISGKTTLTNTLKFPHPSILAASIKSLGISSIACRIIKTPKAVGNGNINARKVFSHPKFFTIKKRGTTITSDGTTIVKTRNKNHLSFPLKSIFAKAKPANEHTVNVNITPTTATKTLLKM